MKYSKYSVVIIGSGIAGLYAALKIEQQTNLDDGILLITKSKLGESNSRYAQGGMVAVMKDNKTDSTESHITDTLKAGAGLSEFNAVKFISEHYFFIFLRSKPSASYSPGSPANIITFSKFFALATALSISLKQSLRVFL